MMELYVQSRGYDQDKDYRWLKILQDGSRELQLPPLSKKAITLIQSDSPSVVLERLQEDRLLLLITGIEPEGRGDFLDRQIRIDVAWVRDNTEENELALRRVAARALREKDWNDLSKEVSQAVTLLKDQQLRNVASEDMKENEYGFRVSFSDMLRLASVKPEELSSSQEPDRTKKIGKNVLKLREELAEELQRCDLPKEQDPLVVVTGFKKRETLEQAGVWRSLSKLVDTEDWEKITRKSDSVWEIVELKGIIGLPMQMVNGLMSFRKKILAELLSRETDREQ